MPFVTNFPPEDNGHLMLIESQVGSMKKHDQKHVELDDRVSAFIQADGDDRYTGWIYYTNGAMPVMTFENVTLKQLVADAYEQCIFTMETAGQLYNRFNVNELQSATAELTKEIYNENGPSVMEMTAQAPELRVDDVVTEPAPPFPPNFVTMDQVGNEIVIRILKSVSRQVVDAHPELSAREIFELVKSKSHDWISNKIKKLMDEGYEQKQAVAIAYSMAGTTKSKERLKRLKARRGE